MLYAIFAAAALLPALLGLEPVMKPGKEGWNTIFHIRMYPRTPLSEEGWKPTLAQELVEWLFCRIASVTMGAVVAGWLGPIFGIFSVFVFYVIVRQSKPGYRICEYLGLAAEMWQGRSQGIERYMDEAYAADWLRRHYPKYFADRTQEQVEAGLRRALPLSKVLLALMRRRFRRLSA